MFSCEILATSYKEIKKMTKEDLIKAMYILIVDNNPELASNLIWDLWMDHGSYKVEGSKILHKETGKELGEK